ncbi:hypothetical protein HYALB_00001187 [Hymenoscyphus albidus]|uniref:Uncharacterized protein n=1 Tax=Hymenoscyphus albidus TaxID=595503 RepID=A0A9N9Q3U3_9HELO|nr:hypothetical protein HYALB_00001187 [Hymenoscyphus albidus]
MSSTTITTHFYLSAALVLTDLVVTDAGFHAANSAELYLASIATDNPVDFFFRNCVAILEMIFPKSGSIECEGQLTFIDEFKEQLGACETDEKRFELFKNFIDRLKELCCPISDIKENFLALLEKGEDEDGETFEQGDFLIDIFDLLRGQIREGEPFAEEFVAWLRALRNIIMSQQSENSLTEQEQIATVLQLLQLLDPQAEDSLLRTNPSEDDTLVGPLACGHNIGMKCFVGPTCPICSRDCKPDDEKLCAGSSTSQEVALPTTAEVIASSARQLEALQVAKDTFNKMLGRIDLLLAKNSDEAQKTASLLWDIPRNTRSRYRQEPEMKLESSQLWCSHSTIIEPTLVEQTDSTSQLSTSRSSSGTSVVTQLPNFSVSTLNKPMVGFGTLPAQITVGRSGFFSCLSKSAASLFEEPRLTPEDLQEIAEEMIRRDELERMAHDLYYPWPEETLVALQGHEDDEDEETRLRAAALVEPRSRGRIEKYKG